MTVPRGQAVEEETLENLRKLPRHEKLTEDSNTHNTDNARLAESILETAASEGKYVQINGHESPGDDRTKGLVIPLLTNEGHRPGMSAQALLDIMEKNGNSLSTQLGEYARENIGEVGPIDFFSITVFD